MMYAYTELKSEHTLIAAAGYEFLSAQSEGCWGVTAK